MQPPLSLRFAMSDTTSPLESSAPVERNEGRWPISRDLRTKAVKVVEEALDGDDPRLATSAAKLLGDIDSLNIRDEIEEDKRRRLDAGMPTERLDAGTLGDAAKQIADELARLTGGDVARKQVGNEADNDLRLDGPEDG